MIDKYWEERKNYRYYKEVTDLLDDLGYKDSIIDVGSYNTPVVTYGNFDKRYRIDKEKLDPIEGVIDIQKDWLDVDLSADVITCLQTLEHLDDDEIKPFCKKLKSSAETLIVSVPYNWDEDRCEWHKQDPVDLKKVCNWFEVNSLILHHYSQERLVLLF
jgi:hypothetical protein